VSDKQIVDIIMPNYNKGKYLRYSIQSIIQQTFKKWRLIILDNNSNDNSKTVLNEFIANKNIEIIKLKRNKGAAFSRNLGLRFSNSEYIAFLDSDDYWHKEKLEKQLNFMKLNKVDFSFTNYTPFLENNGESIFKKEISPKLFYNYEKFVNDTSISTSSMIIKSKIISNIKFPNVKSLEDYIFKCRILKNGYIAKKFNFNGVFYRITKNSLSSNRIENFFLIYNLNKSFNKMNFFSNLKSIFFISLMSIKKYGLK